MNNLEVALRNFEFEKEGGNNPATDTATNKTNGELHNGMTFVDKPVYQKERRTLKNLPYYSSNQLENESALHLEQILRNISTAVLTRDFLRGLPIYTTELNRYLGFHGLKITKEQNITLVKLYIEIYTMEPCILSLILDNNVFTLLHTLLGKFLLTRDDLVIKWRPFYQMYKKYCWKNEMKLSSSHIERLEDFLIPIIYWCRQYFEDGAAQEIYEELSQYLYPVSDRFTMAVKVFDTFMPYHFCEEDQAERAHLVDRLLEYYNTFNNDPKWGEIMWEFLSGATFFMPGKISWKSYLPQMYARITRCYNFPVHYKGVGFVPSAEPEGLSSQYIAKWIVSTLGNNEEALNHLKLFLHSLDTYFHSSNEGDWTEPLRDLLENLVEIFFFRFQRERYSKVLKEWWMRTPAANKLTDEDRDVFVEMTSSLIFNYYLNCGKSLGFLAKLCPSLIVPLVVEKYTRLVDTFTESNRLLITMDWVHNVLLPMLSYRKSVNGYDGRHHLIPFVQSLLLAIDFNDIDKTISAMRCLKKIVRLVPFVDCSALANSVQDVDERQLCLATHHFKELTAQLVQKILCLVGGNRFVNSREFDYGADLHIAQSGDDDAILAGQVFDFFHLFSIQTSSSIYQIASEIITPFVLDRIFDLNSADIILDICYACITRRSEVFLPKFIPTFCSYIIQRIAEDPNLLDDENDETLWFRLILCFDAPGWALLQYRSELESMLMTVLHSNVKQGRLVMVLLKSFLQSLTSSFPKEVKSSEADYDDSNYLAIQDWGMPMKTEKENANAKWYIPGQAELDWAKEIYLKIFVEISSHFENIEYATKSDPNLNKQLIKYINILCGLKSGMVFMSDFRQDESIERDNSKTMESSRFRGYTTDYRKQKFRTPGKNEDTNTTFFKILSNVMAYLTKFKSDDVDAFLVLLNALEMLILPSFATTGLTVNETISLVRKENWRIDVIMRSSEFHLQLIQLNVSYLWTTMQENILKKVLELCVHRYLLVRTAAQHLLQKICEIFKERVPESTIVEFFLEKLQADVPYHEYKGTLYTLFNQFCFSGCCTQSWKTIRSLWAGLVSSPFSEKESIIIKMTQIVNALELYLCYEPLQLHIPAESRVDEYALRLCSEKSLANLTTDKSEVSHNENKVYFAEIVEELAAALLNSNKHWRRHFMSLRMLFCLDRLQEFPFTTKVVDAVFQSVISDSTEVRNCGLYALIRILSQKKRIYFTINVDVEKDTPFPKGVNIHSLLQCKAFCEDKSILNAYEDPQQSLNYPELHIHKSFLGYESVGKTLKLKFGPEDFEDMSLQEEDRILVLESARKYFADEEFMEKLLQLWSLEEEPDWTIFYLYHYVTRSTGPQGVAATLQQIISTHSEEFKDEYKQRYFCNVLCGILSGMKLWRNEQVADLWAEVEPILSKWMDNITEETVSFWSDRLDSPLIHRNPNKMKFFVEYLRERLIRSIETAEMTSVEVLRELGFYTEILQTISWRGIELATDALNIVYQNFLDCPSPYLSVRRSLARFLVAVFKWDVNSPVVGIQEYNGPKIKPFVDLVLKYLENIDTMMGTDKQYTISSEESEENAKMAKLVLTYKTAMEWIIAMCTEIDLTVPLDLYRFLPVIFEMENCESDTEIVDLSVWAQSSLAERLVKPCFVDTILQILANCAASSCSWKVRVSVLEFLKVFTWTNMSVVASRPNWTEKAGAIVLSLLTDRQVEVRETAGHVLSSFLHCRLIAEPMKLLSKWKRSANGFSAQRSALKGRELETVHSVVLGLCAFVDSHPYDIPQFIPDTIISICAHVDDPQPISTCCRNCILNFRRTHYPDWEEHEKKFSAVQLDILALNFVSPCYYA